MKLAVIGGAGVRTPLLIHGLTRSDVPISSVCLYDPDQERLGIIAPLAARLSGGAAVTASTSVAECVEGADFVFTSIRVGGIEGRARDEATALDHGVVGQETVGPGGFAMAMRTIPHIVGYAREVERRAPNAWIINFTNPVGMITEAVRTATGAKIIGICDTPTELFEEIAHALELPSQECHFDYFGLNHLGWVREVYHGGRPQLHRLWDDPKRLASIYRVPLFDPAFLRQLRVLPTEYVYYYYRARDAFENVKRSGKSRGYVIQQLNVKLFEDLAQPGAEARTVYEAYLAARDGSYMQIESGTAAPRKPSPWAAMTGYDKIALSVLRAIHFNTGAIIPLNVSNRGNLPELEADDVVEVPCTVTLNGALPLHVGAVPTAVLELLLQVKDYERRTVKAALSGDRDAARNALARNPLVADQALARRLIDAMHVGE